MAHKKEPKKIPSLKKSLRLFLTSEEGKITKTEINKMAGASVGLGMGVVSLLLSVTSSEAACTHSSHGSHSSHASHNSHGSY